MIWSLHIGQQTTLPPKNKDKVNEIFVNKMEIRKLGENFH